MLMFASVWWICTSFFKIKKRKKATGSTTTVNSLSKSERQFLESKEEDRADTFSYTPSTARWSHYHHPRFLPLMREVLTETASLVNEDSTTSDAVSDDTPANCFTKVE